jgi:Glycosyl hydrolases family 16
VSVNLKVYTERSTRATRVAAPQSRQPGRETRIAVVTVLIFGAALTGVLLFSLSGDAGSASTATTVPAHGVLAYPVGTPNPNEPSGMSPTKADALSGFSRKYASDFPGAVLPEGWAAFTGKPGGDPGGQFSAAHVTVGGGMLRLNTWRDPAYGMHWVTGGLCHCSHAQIYGAYFVRSRITGAGPNESHLLWPLSNQWPPEIDFNETGEVATSTSWTVHFGAANSIVQQTLNLDMTKWHTWGVIWTPTTITFTVDGMSWGALRLAASIPTIPMTLDLQQRTDATYTQAKGGPQSMLVDWVTEYVQD